MSLKAYISKISYYLPEDRRENPKSRLMKKTGIGAVHISDEQETASDLAFNAADKLLSERGTRADVDFLVFCTQSPDYILPTTACILQDRLGLGNNCGSYDFNLGCSGYIYGLSMAKGLVETGQAQNVLLLTGETYSKYINPDDNTVKPLFGDAGTATLIEGFDSEISGLRSFSFGTNGSGYENLIVPVGGARYPFQSSKIIEDSDEYGNKRTNQNLYMNGSAISDFALEVVPDTVNKVLLKEGIDKSVVDYYVFHQANKFMLEFLQQKCDLLGRPFWNDVSEYGNTVSCSIPIALCDLKLQEPDLKLEQVMIAGFGVGLSWAGCMINLNEMKATK